MLNESIALFTSHENISTFDISVLGELGAKELWFKLFIVGSPPCFETLPCIEIFKVGKKGKIFFKTKDSKLVWFDLNTNTIKHLGFKVDRLNRSGRIIIYNKNMLSIGAISI